MLKSLRKFSLRIRKDYNKRKRSKNSEKIRVVEMKKERKKKLSEIAKSLR